MVPRRLRFCHISSIGFIVSLRHAWLWSISTVGFVGSSEPCPGNGPGPQCIGLITDDRSPSCPSVITCTARHGQNENAGAGPRSLLARQGMARLVEHVLIHVPSIVWFVSLRHAWLFLTRLRPVLPLGHCLQSEAWPEWQCRCWPSVITCKARHGQIELNVLWLNTILPSSVYRAQSLLAQRGMA